MNNSTLIREPLVYVLTCCICGNTAYRYNLLYSVLRRRAEPDADQTNWNESIIFWTVGMYWL
jgi:hypothetical protein